MLFRRKTSPPAGGGAPLILIVDDEQDLCDLLRLALLPWGYAVEVAFDGQNGLDRAKALLPSLIVLDIKMPRLNGYQVLARLQQNPALAHIPVIVITSVTGDSDASDDEWTRRLGVKKFISKPFSPEVMVEAVRELIPPPMQPASETT
ncbi:MAG: response regulator [bacterium]|nr:response regulator [bacterium]